MIIRTDTQFIGILAATFAFVLVAGCDRDGGAAGGADSPSPRESFVSQQAPYRVELPAGWTTTRKPDKLNPHADLAATRDERLFAIVIPQKLPELDGVDPPGADALKDASLERMRSNVNDLRVEQEGPVSLEGGEGVSVFAEGTVDDDTVQYIATFVTHGHWGYQIIAWGPAEDEAELVDQVDSLIGGWQFRDDSLPSDAPDAAETDTP